ncbi:YibE/F family protein [Vagococcus salmoninarum]|uniref:YibE/F family protein n=1 Tax=Vagococcus salmoninarum TaxID=2739 RepID=UPI001D13FD74|nr:YibE/F family protein [Vagococcus salmoninarum]
MQQNKQWQWLKKLGCWCVVIVVLSPIYFRTKNYESYQETIGVVTQVSQGDSRDSEDEWQNRDREYQQQVTFELKNGEFQGQRLTLPNSYTYSGVNDQRYQLKDKVFLDVKTEDGQLAGGINGVKRDESLAFLACLFILLLLIVGQKSGFFSLISLVVNGLFLSSLIDLFIKSNSTKLLLFFILGIPLFVIVSLVLVSGFNQKTGGAIIATLLGTYLSFSVGWLVITLLNHRGLRYEEMGFITRSPVDIFLASLLVGCLGAVMDVAMTIASSLHELTLKKPDITSQELIHSGKIIGKDLMGLMANVLLFSYISGALPLIIVLLKNRMSFNYTFSMVLSLEFGRALVGSLGIVLTIPLTIYTVVALLKFRRKPA